MDVNRLPERGRADVREVDEDPCGVQPLDQVPAEHAEPAVGSEAQGRAGGADLRVREVNQRDPQHEPGRQELDRLGARIDGIAALNTDERRVPATLARRSVLAQRAREHEVVGHLREHGGEPAQVVEQRAQPILRIPKRVGGDDPSRAGEPGFAHSR